MFLLGFTFLAGLGFWYFGRRVSEVQTERLRKFDKDLTDAKTELSKQQQRAAEAERQLQLVKKKQEPRGVPEDIISATKNAPHGIVLMEYQEGCNETSLLAISYGDT